MHGKNKWSSLKIVLDGKTFKGYLEGKLIYSLEMQSSNVTKISAPLKDVYGSVRNLKVYGKNGNLLNGGWAMPDTWSVTDGIYTNTTISDVAKKNFASDSGELFFEGSLDGVCEITADVSFEQGTGADDHIGIAVTVDENYTYRLVIEPNAGYFEYENELSFPLASVIKSGELNFEGLEYDEQYRSVLTLLNDGEEVISSGTSVSSGASDSSEMPLSSGTSVVSGSVTTVGSSSPGSSSADTCATGISSNIHTNNKEMPRFQIAIQAIVLPPFHVKMS